MRDIQVIMIDDSEALALVTTKAMHKLITGLGWIDAGRWLNREATLYFRDEVAANATDDKPSRDRFDHVVVAHHDGYADRVARTRDFIEAVSRNTGRSAISLLDGLAAEFPVRASVARVYDTGHASSHVDRARSGRGQNG